MNASISLSVRGSFAAIGRRTDILLERALDDAAGLVVRAAKDKVLSPPKSGRIYRRKGRTHQASAPGEPPANDTGNLVQSIYRRKGVGKERQIVLKAEYAHVLEFGGRHVQPRPFMRPAVTENAEACGALYRKALIDGAGR
jgi:HK97 gp10 family phage protein